MTTTVTPVRSWRLRGYATGPGKVLVVDRTITGDRELDQALKVLERDPNIGRTTVGPA